jgi:hypothetical protein
VRETVLLSSSEFAVKMQARTASQMLVYPIRLLGVILQERS